MLTVYIYLIIQQHNVMFNFKITEFLSYLTILVTSCHSSASHVGVSAEWTVLT